MNAPDRTYRGPVNVADVEPQKQPGRHRGGVRGRGRDAGGSKQSADRWMSFNRLVEDKCRELKPSAFAVAVVLFKKADAKTHRVRISISKLADITGLSRRQVIRIVKELQRSEVVKVISRGNSLTGEPGTYQYLF